MKLILFFFAVPITPVLPPSVLCSNATWNLTGISIDGVYACGYLTNQLSYPLSLAFDSQQNLFIADSGNYRIQKLFRNGTTILTIMTNVRVTALFIDRYDDLYFTDIFTQTVKKLNSASGVLTILAGNGSAGAALNQLNFPFSIYVDRNQTLYVSDCNNNRVVKWSQGATQGVIIAGGNTSSNASNRLRSPRGIFVDETNEIGALYVCDTENYRVQKFLRNQIPGVTVAGGNGISMVPQPNQLYAPSGIIVDPNTRIMYISDYDGVIRWPSGAVRGQNMVGRQGQSKYSEFLYYPRGILFDSQWDLYVADEYNCRVQKFVFNTRSCVSSSSN